MQKEIISLYFVLAMAIQLGIVMYNWITGKGFLTLNSTQYGVFTITILGCMIASFLANGLSVWPFVWVFLFVYYLVSWIKHILINSE